VTTNIHFLSHLGQLLLEREKLQSKVSRKSKPTFYVQQFFSENRTFYNMEKYCRAGQATDDNKVNGHCTLDT